MVEYEFKVKEEKGCRVVAECRIKREVVGNELDREILELQKSIEMPGFRAGKAPLELVKKRYGEKILKKVIENLIFKSVNEFIEKKGLKVAIEPLVSNISYSDDLRWETIFECHPDVTPREYKGIKIKRKIRYPNENDVNVALRGLAEMNACIVESDSESVSIGGLVAVDLRAYDGEKVVDKLRRDNILIDLSRDEIFLQLKEALVGMRRGESKRVVVDMPEDYIHKELASKKILFDVVVKSIKKKVIPEINDEFAKNLGYEDLEKLKLAVIDELKRRFERECNEDINNQVFEHLLKANKFDMPPTLLERETMRIFNEYIEYCKRGGIEIEFVKKNFKEIINTCYNSAYLNLAINYVLDGIARKEGITVSEDEILDIKEDLKKRLPEDVSADRFFEKNLLKIVDGVKQRKVIDFILKHAHIEEV